MRTEQLLEQMKAERNEAVKVAEAVATLAISLDNDLEEALEDLDDLEDELVDAFMKIEELELAYQNMEAKYARLLAFNLIY